MDIIQPNKLRKFVIFTVTRCLRSLTNHPFLVGLLCFFIFLQKLSPLLFSFLLSCSPVLISTALLLGTLLSFGQPNIPEIETEEVIHDRTISFKAEEDGRVFQEPDSYSEKGEDGERSISSEQLSLLQGKVEIHRAYFSDDNASLVDEKLPQVELENVDGEEVVKNHYVLVPANDEHLDLDDESSSSEADSFGSEMRDYVGLPSSPTLSTQRKVEDEEEDEEEEEEWDSESDRAESSSPDASMADIRSMLHDLNPLLGEESPRQVHESFDDVMEKRGDLEVEEDDDSEEDEEEETKPVVTWTQEDQMNLLDLGNSENERNVRLENLILRMRARKVHERNLIDLDSFDLPFNLSPIMTNRRNPFDLPHDPDEPPPVPGSAPSILLSRENPFGNRYGSSEKLNLMADEFQSPEPFSLRHQRSNPRPSVFAPNRQESRDVKLAPYFVAEGTVLTESIYSSLQRQVSEVSEFKVSSDPETESLGSVEDLDDRNLIDEENEQFPVSSIQEETQEGENELISESEEISEEDMQRAQGLIYKIELVSVGQCSEEGDHHSPKYHVEESDAEFQLRDVSVERGYSRVSSSSSLSEASERVFTETDGQWPSFLERRENSAEGSGTLTWAFEESTNLTVESEAIHGADSAELREPVYGLSPTAVRNLNLLPSSVSSKIYEEPNLVSLEGSSQATLDNISSVEMLPESTMLAPVDEYESGVVDESGHGELNSDLSKVNKKSKSECASTGTGVAAILESSIEASFEVNLMDPFESLVHVSKEPSESQSSEEHSFQHERTTDNSKSHVQSSNPGDLISTTAEENAASLSCDHSVHEPNLGHHDFLQESNTHVHELDHNTIADDKYPLSRDFITIPPTASEAASHAKLQTIVEDVDEIKNIDEDILSQLDIVGEFSTNQRGYITNEFGEHVDFIGESSSSTHHIETSNVNIFEFNSFETNATEEHAISSGKSDDGIDIHEEEKLLVSETCTLEHEHISHTKFNESEYEDGTICVKNEGVPVHSEIDHNVDSLPVKSESTHEECTDAFCKVEDPTCDEVIHSPYEQISDEKIEKPAAVEPPRDKLLLEEVIIAETSKIHKDVVDHIPHVVDSREEPSVTESIPAEGTSLSPEELMLDEKTKKELNTDTHRGAVEIDAQAPQVESSQDEQPFFKQTRAVAAENPEEDRRASGDLHSPVSTTDGKGKTIRGSVSSTSSSPESSPGDPNAE